MNPQERMNYINKKLAVIQEVKKSMIELHTTLITDYYRPQFAELGVISPDSPQYTSLVAEKNKRIEDETNNVMSRTTEQKELEAELRLLEAKYGR